MTKFPDKYGAQEIIRKKKISNDLFLNETNESSESNESKKYIQTNAMTNIDKLDHAFNLITI